MLNIWKPCLAVIALASASLAVPSAALAEKPGGAGQNGGGLIYYSYNNKLYTMKDDGSGVALVTAFPRAPLGEPSRNKHAGKRWIVQRQSVPNEFYPNATPRQELVALSDAGDVVTLPLPPDLEPFQQPRWMVGDNAVSWTGRKWDNDPESPTFGDVREGGLFLTPLAYDESDNLVGIEGGSSLLVTIPWAADGVHPDIDRYDWSLDGTQFVYGTLSSQQLIVADMLLGTFEVILTSQHVSDPRWSPAGNKFMFRYRNAGQQAGVWIMNADGSGLTMLEADRTRSRPEVGVWSPKGTHLIYQHNDRVVVDSYIMRTKADGSGGTRITSKSMGAGEWAPFPLGWRQ